jgi:hypothetical protein
MEKKKLTIEVDSNIDDVVKDMAELKKGFENTQKSIDDTNKALQDVAKATEGNTKATKMLADGFKGIGLATKAMGIGLLMDGLSMLKDIFMKNEKVAKLVSTAMETVSIVFTDIVNVITGVIEKVYSSSNGFEHLGKVIMGLINLSFTPLKLAFYSIKLAIDEFRLGWEQSVFGDGDTKKINELTKRINETKDSIVKTGKDAIQSGKDVVNNFSGAVKEVGAVVEGSIDGISKISISGALAQAKANVEVKNNAIIAAAEQQRLIELYDRQAEKLRQIRDDDTKSISDRIKANDALGAVLDKQQAAMLKQADLQIEAARIEESKNKTAENTAAVIEAQANRLGVLAQIEGLRSEQLVNKNSLQKEYNDLQQTEIDGAAKRATENTKFNNSMIKDITDRLAAERKAIEEEAKLEQERLTIKRDAYTKGTQAWADANQEILNAQAVTSQALITNEAATQTALADENKKRIDKIKGDNTLSFEERFAALSAELTQINSTEYTSDEDRNNAIAANRASRTAMEIEFEAKKNEAIANSKANLTNIIAGLEASGLAKTKAGQVLAKAIALTQIGIDSAVAISKASTLANAEGVAAQLAFPMVPGIGTIARVVSYASTVMSVASNIAKAKQLLSSGGGGAPSAGGESAGASPTGATPPQAPTFNVVGNSGVNQLAQTIAGQGANQAPIQAYVVSGQVTTAQSLDRNRVDNATMG